MIYSYILAWTVQLTPRGWVSNDFLGPFIKGVLHHRAQSDANVTFQAYGWNAYKSFGNTFVKWVGYYHIYAVNHVFFSQF